MHIVTVEGDKSDDLKFDIRKEMFEGYYIIVPKIVANTDTCESSMYMYTNTCTHSHTCAHMHTHTHTH